MKKTTKKGASKAAHKKAIRNLQVKPAKGGTVRGGIAKIQLSYEKWIEL